MMQLSEKTEFSTITIICSYMGPVVSLCGMVIWTTVQFPSNTMTVLALVDYLINSRKKDAPRTCSSDPRMDHAKMGSLVS